MRPITRTMNGRGKKLSRRVTDKVSLSLLAFVTAPTSSCPPATSLIAMHHLA